MAVVTKYAQGYKDPAALYPVPPLFAEGQVRSIIGSVAVANGDSAASKHYFGQVPSNAIIHPDSLIYSTGITGTIDYDIGLEQAGTVKDADILADGIDVSGAGSDAVTASVATANIAKRLYELLGLANDPGVMYDIVGVIKVAATAAGTLVAVIKYSR